MKAFRPFFALCLIALAGCAAAPKPAPALAPARAPRAQTVAPQGPQARKPAIPPIPPAHADVAYGTRNGYDLLMDVYLAKSDKPTPALIYIHGGGWNHGNKRDSSCNALVKQMLPMGISVVSVEYTFSRVAPHPAQVEDCSRAVQFVRHNAKAWNIAPDRLGAIGGSAGGHLATWIGMHDSAAKPKSKDPVERESSRVACVVNCAGPSDFRLVREIEHTHPAYREVFGLDAATPADQIPLKLLTSMSPVCFVSPDDPPVLSFYGDIDGIVPMAHAESLHKALDKAGVENRLVVVEGGTHAVAGIPEFAFDEGIAFLKRHLLGDAPAPPKPSSSRITIRIDPAAGRR